MKKDKYIAYEEEKAKLEKLNLSPEEYERTIRELARKLKL
jgi:predicted metal-binding transcription factor (methanogenesis marker protein 9)